MRMHFQRDLERDRRDLATREKQLLSTLKSHLAHNPTSASAASSRTLASAVATYRLLQQQSLERSVQIESRAQVMLSQAKMGRVGGEAVKGIAYANAGLTPTELAHRELRRRVEQEEYEAMEEMLNESLPPLYAPHLPPTLTTRFPADAYENLSSSLGGDDGTAARVYAAEVECALQEAGAAAGKGKGGLLQRLAGLTSSEKLMYRKEGADGKGDERAKEAALASVRVPYGTPAPSAPCMSVSSLGVAGSGLDVGGNVGGGMCLGEEKPSRGRTSWVYFAEEEEDVENMDDVVVEVGSLDTTVDSLKRTLASDPFACSQLGLIPTASSPSATQVSSHPPVSASAASTSTTTADLVPSLRPFRLGTVHPPTGRFMGWSPAATLRQCGLRPGGLVVVWVAGSGRQTGELCEVKLNFPAAKDACIKVAKVLSKGVVGALGKPEAYMQVYVIPDVALTFGGTEAPAALAQISSIGGIASANNKKTAAVVVNALQSEFPQLSGDRVYILFSDIPGANWAQNATTFG
ncbi:hypothetical protein HDU93_000663 [Gonapodya sp. JEL0774]|nr:hypothetical protein HDU93_000663 [Gonapodya sp. JEL0774]